MKGDAVLENYCSDAPLLLVLGERLWRASLRVHVEASADRSRRMGDWIEMSPDGSVVVVRTDTYAAYLWNGTAWKQLVTTVSMPPDDRRLDRNSGVYELMVSGSIFSTIFGSLS